PLTRSVSSAPDLPHAGKSGKTGAIGRLSTHAHPVPAARRHRLSRRARLCGHVRAVGAGAAHGARGDGAHSRPRPAAGCARMKEGHLIEAFLEMMSAERGAAANTIEAY